MAIPKDVKSYTPLPKIYTAGPRTREAPGFTAVEGETIPRRNAKTYEALVTSPDPSAIKTMPDILKYASAKYGNAKALGSRKLIKTHNDVKKIKKTIDGKETETEKKWTFFELSGYEYKTFAEFEKIVLELGAGLRKLGMNTGDKVHMFAATQ
jgi:long-chain acyl-CoA synthetase